MREIRNWYKLLEGAGLVANDSGPAVAQGALSADVTWAPYYSAPKTILYVTGTLSPDVTGTYPFGGFYNGQPYFERSAGWFIWRHIGDAAWVLSESLGVYGADGWLNESTGPDESYIAYGAATGIAYGTLDEPIPYDYKGVIIGASESRIVSAAAAGFPAAAGSIEMLIRPTWNNADGLTHTFFDTYGGNNKVFSLVKGSDNLTKLTTNSTARGTTTFAWTAHETYHVVVNWGVNELWINGTLAHDFTDGGLGTGATTLYIGDRHTTANNAISASVYYFIARDVALTASEIATFKAFFEDQYLPA
jgi:hypothetical protein